MTTVRPLRIPIGEGDTNGDWRRHQVFNERGELDYTSSTTSTTTTERPTLPENENRHSQQMLELVWDDSEEGMTKYRLLYNQTNRGTWRSEQTWINGEREII